MKTPMFVFLMVFTSQQFSDAGQFLIISHDYITIITFIVYLMCDQVEIVKLGLSTRSERWKKRLVRGLK